jgi:hypothetical protein
MNKQILTEKEIESVVGGINTWDVVDSALSGGATFGAVGVSIGVFSGPAAPIVSLVGGLIGFGFGVVGGTYSAVVNA